MRKAAVYNQAWGGRSEGQIERVLADGETWDIFLINDGTCVLVDVPEEADAEFLTATGSVDNWTVMEDTDGKNAFKRASKLAQIEQEQRRILDIADIEIFKLEDVSGDTSSWRTYRQNVRLVNDAYKNYATDSGHAAALDALSDNPVSELSWPSTP